MTQAITGDFRVSRRKNTVPVEGVLACVEVKFNLTASDVRGCVTTAQKIRKMERKAPLSTPFQMTYNLYDREWNADIIYYTMLAYETDNLLRQHAQRTER